MFIILTKDDFFGYDFVIDYLGKAKQFKTLEEAELYICEMEIYPSQIIKVTI